MKIIKILVGILVTPLLALGAVYLYAGFHDGPLALIPGGPLVAGELVGDPVADWGFAKSVEEIELQLDGTSRSRTTWILVNDQGAFVPCSLGFPPGKEWHLAADLDGGATVRILGKRYAVTLNRVQDAGLQTQLKKLAAVKYDGGPPGDGETWFFRLEPDSV